LTKLTATASTLLHNCSTMRSSIKLQITKSFQNPHPEFGQTCIFSNLSNLPYSRTTLLPVQTSSLMESERQGSETRPVLGVAGVSTRENVAPGLLVQKPQHTLVIDLLRSVKMTTTTIIKTTTTIHQSSR